MNDDTSGQRRIYNGKIGPFSYDESVGYGLLSLEFYSQRGRQPKMIDEHIMFLKIKACPP